MPTATDFQALRFQNLIWLGTLNGFQTLSTTAGENDFRFEMPVADALALFWNTDECQLTMGYTHALTGSNNYTWVASKTASEQPMGTIEPADRIDTGKWELSLGGAGTVDSETHTINGASNPDSFGSTMSLNATAGLRLYEGSSSSVALVEFKVFVWNRISLALPTQLGFIVTPDTGADIDSSGYGGLPATWWETHDVTLDLFGQEVDAVFAARLGDPVNSPTSTLTGFSFEVTTTNYTY